MLKRAIFGAIYVAVIVGGILGGQFLFLLLLMLLNVLAVNEFLTMVSPQSDNSADRSLAMMLRSLDCVGGAIMITIFWTGNFFWPGFITYIAYVMFRLIVQLWVTGQNPLLSLATSMMSQLYVALPIAMMRVLFYNFGPYMLLTLFVMVWFNDTFAYLSGRMLGRHKLWERISPKKTWEGFWGGTIMTVIAAMLCAKFAPQFYPGITIESMAVLALIVAVAGTLGDLVESMLKRTVGVKDSGNLIPGHGGILDRIDSILLVIPAATAFLYFINV